MVMAEESNPGKIKLRHPLTAKRVVEGFPNFLDMTRFEALELIQGYNFKSSNDVYKVLLCSSSASSTEVLVLYHKGVLGKFSLHVLGSKADVDDESDSDEDDKVSYSWENLKLQRHCKWFKYLDDVVKFRDMTCAVDRQGMLYMLDLESMIVANASVLVSKPICRRDIRIQRRKRLAVDPTLEKLYLVVRENIQVAQKVRFKLYNLNEEGKRWNLVDNIGNKRVLFVGINHCFFAMARHFPGCHGNSIVFASNCFSRYDGTNIPDGTLFDDERIDAGVYNLGEGDNFSLLSLACPAFAEIIWPPPTWFSTWSLFDLRVGALICNHIVFGIRRESSEEKTEEHPTYQSSNEVGISSLKCLAGNYCESPLRSGTSSENESISVENDEDGDAVMLSDSSAKDNVVDNENKNEEMESNCSGSVDYKASNKNDRAHSTNSDVNSLDHIGKEHSGSQEQPENERFGSEERTNGSMRKDDQTHQEGIGIAEENVCSSNWMPETPSFSPANERSHPVTFQGVEIRSELLPILETVWAKHGNLIGKDTIRNKNMLGCALGELAKLKIALDNTTGRTLTESKTDELKSNLSDLKSADLRVDWLEHRIENVIEYTAVKKKIAKIEVDQRAYLARTAEAKQELEERIRFLEDHIMDHDR